MPSTPPQSAGCPLVENEHGKLEVLPARPVAATEWGTWRFRWTPAYEVEPGGGLEIIFLPRFPTNRWSLPQTHDPTAPGYVTATAGSQHILDLDILRWPTLQKPHGATLHIIQASVGHAPLRAGQTLEVVYGDTRGGSLGTRAQRVAREVAFPVYVSSGQAPKFFERFVSWDRQTDIATLRATCDFNPTLRVVGAQAASFNVKAPMEVAPGTPFEIGLAALDASANAADYSGRVQVTAGGEPESAPLTRQVDSVPAIVCGLTLGQPGFHRLQVVDLDRGILGVSNPIRVREAACPVYWGELHGHSEQSDGIGTVDEHYTYARDAALLDFACVCDHDRHLYAHPERWDHAQRKVEQYSEPGRFIAMLGYEIRTSIPGSGEVRGDMNAYYRDAEGQMLGPVELPLAPETFADREVILVPHTPLYAESVGMGTRWEELAQAPPELMPAVEIYSTHGNSEYYDCTRHVLWQEKGQSVLDALQKGLRLGFIGSSDYHELLTGGLLRIQDTVRGINHQHMQARCGLAAVCAEELNRESIFDAVRARRTYATSGIRAYLDVEVNGHPMGTAFRLPGKKEPRRVRIAAAAPEPIIRLELIRNGEVIADLADGDWRIETAYEDTSLAEETTFYYVRLTTGRDDFAWSSPIWVEQP